MDSIELDEARNVFIYIMDEMDYHGDPDDLAIYRDIREVFDAGTQVLATNILERRKEWVY
jgi:hypothetical protein